MPTPRSSTPRAIATHLRPHDLSSEERKALRVISETVTVPLDQLARFMKYELSTVHELAAELRRKGCLKSRQFVPGDQPWVWLTLPGARLSGTEFGIRSRAPSPRGLRHRRAIHDVRLLLEERAPHGRWISERRLLRMREKGFELPDGLFEVDGERHAIEVELTRKSNGRIREIVEQNVSRYDAVIYFCSPVPYGQLTRLKEEHGWANLIVREVPGPRPKRGPHYRPPPERPAEAWELEILRFISEQGAVPMDQLQRIAIDAPVSVDRMVRSFCEAGYARSEHLQIGEPAWTWLLSRGARFSKTGLIPSTAPGLGTLGTLRALTALRLQIESSSPDARWISRRLLLRELGRDARAPGAVVEVDGERHAINVRFSRPQAGTRLPSMIDIQSGAYDVVIYLCGTPGIRGYMQDLQRKYEWPKLVIRDLANGLAEPGGGGSRSYLLDSLP